ncbi:MAG: sigma-70 family RNA polymerase sigma factor [Anaerolineaceae bacterium]|nr:MAG: sigma-70 family RNA polymerase sigma factor [Anaerolineaceae bacterium]
MVERPNESEWIHRAMQGDDNAFAMLVEVYQVPVYNLCYRMLGNPMEAEDAAQEAFLRAYKGINRYDPERRFATWLLSIASHHCIDRLRRRKYPIRSLDELLPWQQKADDMPGPETALTQKENQEAVRKMLEQLGDHDRMVLILRYWYDLSYEEIAQSLSSSVSAVKSRLHRARRQLADQWIKRTSIEVGKQGRCDEASAF